MRTFADSARGEMSADRYTDGIADTTSEKKSAGDGNVDAC